MSTEEKLAEKLRIQKQQEESDLVAAMDTFGITADKSGIDAINPTNKTELNELSEAISKKVNLYKHLEDFPGFLEELVRTVCVHCKFITYIIQIQIVILFSSLDRHSNN